MKTKPRTRAQWAQRINATHKAVVASCFKEFQKLGRELLAAKKALPHGEFLQMIEGDLTVGPRAAQILMRVVGDKRLNANPDSHLPKTLTVLHELTRLPDEAIEQGIKDGTINPEMTRSDAKKFVTLKVTDVSHKIVAPFYVSEPTPEPPRKLWIHEPPPPAPGFTGLKELKLVSQTSAKPQTLADLADEIRGSVAQFKSEVKDYFTLFLRTDEQKKEAIAFLCEYLNLVPRTAVPSNANGNGGAAT